MQLFRFVRRNTLGADEWILYLALGLLAAAMLLPQKARGANISTEDFTARLDDHSTAQWHAKLDAGTTPSWRFTLKESATRYAAPAGLTVQYRAATQAWDDVRILASTSSVPFTTISGTVSGSNVTFAVASNSFLTAGDEFYSAIILRDGSGNAVAWAKGKTSVAKGFAVTGGTLVQSTTTNYPGYVEIDPVALPRVGTNEADIATLKVATNTQQGTLIALMGATGTLTTAVGTLNTATGTLQGGVATLQAYDATATAATQSMMAVIASLRSYTGTVGVATSGMNEAVSALSSLVGNATNTMNGRIGTLETNVAALQIVAQTNTLATVVSNGMWSGLAFGADSIGDGSGDRVTVSPTNDIGLMVGAVPGLALRKGFGLGNLGYDGTTFYFTKTAGGAAHADIDAGDITASDVLAGSAGTTNAVTAGGLVSLNALLSRASVAATNIALDTVLTAGNTGTTNMVLNLGGTTMRPGEAEILDVGCALSARGDNIGVCGIGKDSLGTGVAGYGSWVGGQFVGRTNAYTANGRYGIHASCEGANPSVLTGAYVVGVCRADTFVGNGSGLTNLPAQPVTGSVVSVTAGEGLTNIGTESDPILGMAAVSAGTTNCRTAAGWTDVSTLLGGGAGGEPTNWWKYPAGGDISGGGNQITNVSSISGPGGEYLTFGPSFATWNGNMEWYAGNLDMNGNGVTNGVFTGDGAGLTGVDAATFSGLSTSAFATAAQGIAATNAQARVQAVEDATNNVRVVATNQAAASAAGLYVPQSATNGWTVTSHADLASTSTLAGVTFAVSNSMLYLYTPAGLTGMVFNIAGSNVLMRQVNP